MAPSRVLSSDNPGPPDDLPLQLQTADHQSCLSWRDVTESLEDVLKLPPHPVDIVDQVATMILMEEQITHNMFGCIKLLIWRKLSKFVQTIPQITNQLSQGELSCLWENNKDKMMLILLGELFNNRSMDLVSDAVAVTLALKVLKFVGPTVIREAGYVHGDTVQCWNILSSSN